MAKPQQKKKSVFLRAEVMSNSLSLLPEKCPPYLDESSIKGVLNNEQIQSHIEFLKSLDVDEYIAHTVVPSEHQKRKSAPEVIRQLGGRMIHEENHGPLYVAEIEFVIEGRLRRFGFIAQNRKNQSGVWYPQHHLEAAKWTRFFDSHGMPVITFMDTPGAAADTEANAANQSHSISSLIAEMANLTVPTVGIVYGHGYSGGAIPLATTNVLLSLKDAVFNTIHPKGLSNIARKYNLSWQECAKYIGISPYELTELGHFDGVIDYSPSEPKNIENLRDSIFTAVGCVENNAQLFLKGHLFFFDHYKENIKHYLEPSEMLVEDNKMTDKSPTGVLNIFGSVYRFLRYLKLRHKITSQSTYGYSRLSHHQVPQGNLAERVRKEREQKFQKWLKVPLELRYHDTLNKKYKRFLETAHARTTERSKIATLLMGDPKANFEKATDDLTSHILVYLYNFWKGDASDHLMQLHEYLKETPPVSNTGKSNITLIDALLEAPIHQRFQKQFHHILLFDLLYNNLVQHLPMIAGELKGSNHISKSSVEKLFETAFNAALEQFKEHSITVQSQEIREEFFKWLTTFVEQKDCDRIMKMITDWKQIMFPRLSPPLFGLVRYYFAELLPSLYESYHGRHKFDGKIKPRHIGIKDFWHRLDQAYKDLLIHNLLREYKKKPIPPQKIIDLFFSNFEELFASRMTSDPVRFPGFRGSIEKALENDIPACGVITGIADYQHEDISTRVGLVISNSQFQAGAFDMASCEKVCKLLAECANQQLPVFMFISSGGMQTKEGAGALFSMAVVNDRITRFVKDHDLPVICFGFRDCMGGAQASFVTHRLAKTYFLSGTLMPFAGQLVVESHLTTNATLSNYLCNNPGSMDGLVRNPFDEGVDQELQKIDPQMPVAQHSIPEEINRILSGEYRPASEDDAREPKVFSEPLDFQPIQRMLVHARGCTATRLIQAAQEKDIEVVLVQSDADMDSFPAQSLNDKGRLVCIGGNTPQDSYLNGMSVIRIAQQEEADAIHPGIGFLSETPSYAKICRSHGLNFVGPSASSMDLMGNKSNAIATAKRLNIPIVPGSEGALADAEQASVVADEIGFPVLIKAAHGGGGKGIRVVHQKADFVKLFMQMSQEALNAFGNGDLYLEKYIQSMRHLEVQVLRDTHGNSKLLGIRDCSVQRSFQKLIEESADHTVSESIRKELYEYVQRLIDDIDYIGAGTVEFIYDRGEKKVYFMEMNTRLQVEHPVTEMVTGVDLVHQQLDVAGGKNIKDLSFESKGHAIELRINAERIDEATLEEKIGFLPDPGKITSMKLPVTHNIRTLQAAGEGQQIPPYYDSLVLQIIAWGEDRKAAIENLQKYLKNVRIHGIFTNIALMEAILEDERFQSDDYDTHYLEKFFEENNAQELVERAKQYFGDADQGFDRDSIKIESSNELKVLSPQTGAFYRSNSPEEPPFLEEGQTIDTKHTLCLLESMKVFTELSLKDFKLPDGEALYETSSTYKVKRILPEDQQTIGKGDLLFVVEPVSKESAETSEEETTSA